SRSKSYVTMGRAIRKVVSCFDPMEVLVSEYDRRQELQEQREEDGDDTPIMHTAEQNRLYRGFLELRKFVPAIKSALISMEPDQLSTMFSQLQKGAGGAFGDDVNSVRAAMADFVSYSGAKDPLVASSRDNRGAEGEVTGPLIFPVDYDYNDAEVRAKVINGDPKYKITADQWPRGVYQNQKYDPTNQGKGLFKSASLVKTYLHIFTAPQSAKKYQPEHDMERGAGNTSDTENVRPSSSIDEPPRKKRRTVAPPGSSKKSVASKVSMASVTPRSIAYAAVQHRFALSDASHWNEMDGTFSYIAYYNNIVDWFEDAPGPIAQKEVDDLLAWWDQCVVP
ncbi:hypothetical protein K438DRAFT_1473351, partial [Mycena galopus ATCC 62051]